MYCKGMGISCLAVALLGVGICQTSGQEGLPTPNSSYYQPGMSMNYPMLAGNRVSTGGTLDGSIETIVGDIGCGCGIPLLPALAQGIRDTLHCIFPFRGMNRPRGLFFSERFYGANCNGCGQSMHGVIYETSPIESPTPAKSSEEIPAKVAPKTSSVLSNDQGGVTVGSGVRSSLVRPVNYSTPSLPNIGGVRSIPDNPLRR
jgi:hypothetical protein